MNIKKYIPTILTAASCVGVVGCGYLGGKTTLKAYEVMNKNHVDIHVKEDREEAVRIFLKCGWPLLLCEAITIGSIIVNHKWNSKQIASIIGASAYSSKLIHEYRDKIREKYGEEELKDIERMISSDREKGVVHSVDPNIQVYGFMNYYDEFHEGGVDLFHDIANDIWFRSSLYDVRTALYHINRNYVMGKPITIKEYFQFLGIERDNKEDDISGWGTNLMYDGIYWVDFNITENVNDDGEVYYIISPEFSPSILTEEDLDCL